MQEGHGRREGRVSKGTGEQEGAGCRNPGWLEDWKMKEKRRKVLSGA